MSLRTLTVGLTLGVLLGGLVSCATPLGDQRNVEGTISGISEGKDGPDEVSKALGKPDSMASGWWRGANSFDIGFKVWYYKGVGRVVFRPDLSTVYATEADKTEDGRPN